MKHPTSPALLLFAKRLAVATTLSLAAFAAPFARAVDGYTVTFHAEAGHTVEVDNGGHLVVDGTFVELRDENGQSIGAASMNGDEGQIQVPDRTPGVVNYGGNAFSLYNSNGHVAYRAGTAISSNCVLLVEDYAEPAAYSMIVRPAEKTIGVPEHAMNEDVLLLTLSVETAPEDAINRVQEFMWYLNGEYYRSTTNDPGSKTSSLPLTYKDLKDMIGQNVYFSVKSYDGICSTKQNPVENGNNVNVDIRSGGFALSLSVDVDELCLDALNPENNRIELKANVLPKAAVNDIDYFYWTDNGVEMTKTHDPVLVVTQAQFPALFVPGKTAIFNVKAYDEVCAQDWVYAPGPGKQVRVVATPSIRVSVGDAVEGEDVTVAATLGYADCTGTVTVAVAGGEYVGAVEDGVANVIIPGLAAGEHEATATYSGDDKYLGTSTNCTIKVDVAQAPPVVSNVVARQRWPWNGLVDVDYEIGGYTDNYWVEISFAEQGGAGRCWTATNFVGCVEPGYEPGRHRATWDTKADGVTNVVASNVVATVRLIEMPLVDAQFDGVAGHLQDLGYTVEESGGRHLYKGGAKVAELEIPAVFTSRRTHRRYRVVGVAEQAFLKCVDLKKVILPEAVTNIAKEAFAYCGLTSMEVPDGVVNIGEEAFSWCRSMSSVSLPSSLKTIGRGAFYTAGLKSIEIPDSVTSIGEDAFYFCPNLKSASILGGVGTLPRMLFAECDMLESVTIGEGVKTMVEYAFYKCIRLKTVSLPESLEEIDRFVFAYDESLDDVYVPTDVISIGTEAFLNVKHITYYGSAVGAKWGAAEWN